MSNTQRLELSKTSKELIISEFNIIQEIANTILDDAPGCYKPTPAGEIFTFNAAIQIYYHNKDDIKLKE